MTRAFLKLSLQLTPSTTTGSDAAPARHADDGCNSKFAVRWFSSRAERACAGVNARSARIVLTRSVASVASSRSSSCSPGSVASAKRSLSASARSSAAASSASEGGRPESAPSPHSREPPTEVPPDRPASDEDAAENEPREGGAGEGAPGERPLGAARAARAGEPSIGGSAPRRGRECVAPSVVGASSERPLEFQKPERARSLPDVGRDDDDGQHREFVLSSEDELTTNLRPRMTRLRLFHYALTLWEPASTLAASPALHLA